MRVSIEELRELASRLKFDMSDDEYEMLQEEFEVILSQMELLGEIDNTDGVIPMTFPRLFQSVGMREDEVENVLTAEDVIRNSKDSVDGLIKVKKVVQ